MICGCATSGRAGILVQPGNQVKGTGAVQALPFLAYHCLIALRILPTASFIVSSEQANEILT
jgi:hypothetical protein